LNIKQAGNRASTGAVKESLTLFGRRLSILSSNARRLLMAAALLHVALAVGLFCAGRAQIAPSIIDRDGIMTSFASDSYEYQDGAVRLVEILKQEGVAAWVSASAPVHVKLISILFVFLGPLFGYGPLSAEPFNLFCYVAVVGLTLALGREVGGSRAGMLAAVIVALWPTFLLHTLQLLKDGLFIAAALALVLCMTTWLTRTYGPRGAVVTGALMVAAISLLLLIRSHFAVFIFALALFGLVLLIVRQLIEGRTLYWNMACPVLIIMACALLLLFSHARPASQKFKHYPSDQSGQPKSVTSAGIQMPTVVSYLPRAASEVRQPETYAGRLYAVADRMVLRVGSIRYRFTAIYSKSGSNIDSDLRFRHVGDILQYLPRAFEIGLWAPFPRTWAETGRRVGSAGKLLSGAETLAMYVFQLLALVTVVRMPRGLAAWLLLSISVFGVTLLALVVPNIGALYRFRYTFWLLLIILGAKGFEIVVASYRQRFSARQTQAAG
jgi:4-amino-4-deoxy-L-arabinose transferase-like glycosyltransferase